MCCLMVVSTKSKLSHHLERVCAEKGLINIQSGMCEVYVFIVVNYFIIHIKTNPPRVSSKWTSLRAFTRVDYGQAT